MMALVTLIASATWLLSSAGATGQLLDAGPEDTSAFSGESLSLVCDVADSVDSNIIWRYVKNDVWLTNNDYVYPNIGALYSRVTVDVNAQSRIYTLNIRDAHVSDGGVYQCGYESQAGTFIELSEAQVSIVNADNTPECSIYMLPNINNVLGTEVDIKCVWSSDLPNGRALIYRNGQSLTPDVVLQDRAILRTVYDNTASYGCQLVAPLVSMQKPCSVVPLTRAGLKVRSDPLLQTVEVGSDVQFTCTAVANETVESYVWSLKADAIIRFTTQPGRFATRNNARELTLFNMELVDDLLYVKCSAETSDGTIVTTMSITRVLPVGTGSSATLDPTRRTPQKLPRPTTVDTYTSMIAGNDSTDAVTAMPRTDNPVSLTIIVVAAVGGFIFLIIVIALICLVRRICRDRDDDDYDEKRHPQGLQPANTLDTRWVMSMPEIDVTSPPPEPRRFGRKSRSSSRKFLYSRRSSKKKNRSANGTQKSVGVAAHLAPPPAVIVPDPTGIYQNIPKSGSTNSLHSLHSMQHKMRKDVQVSYNSGYEDVDADFTRYKKPRPKVGLSIDDGGYASIEDPEEVHSLVYADLDLTENRTNVVKPELDLSTLYAKVKK